MPGTKIRSATLRLSSPSILEGDPIPSRHSAEGGNVSPELSWSGLPEDTASIAVTCEDPRGPSGEPFTLWILFNVPPEFEGIPEGLSKVPDPPEVPGAEQGINDCGTFGYDGPAPPVGHPAHRYKFRVYALDAILNLSPQATRSHFREAIQGHVLAQGEIIGTFSR